MRRLLFSDPVMLSPEKARDLWVILVSRLKVPHHLLVWSKKSSLFLVMPI